ncbi:hypothetical protein QE422_002903 [Chryseobacterium sp. SORGH_AS 447]|uniref:hypothetical protein n=1 Tax=Chryseobacterium sp. SORGH_AS_0447 TaxID=3041769 RepID=UPI0027876C73|nr:hypothetical protein [Chryseobacterium sp. SORGH_AS_0447]MDQ1162535.1 hypothetical protein [Chryseobacterium sp. SORGH_AS_0447]
MTLTEISYEDEFERAISPAQAATLDRYIKVFSVNGMAKKKEEYRKGERIHLIYYRDPDDPVEAILADYKLFPTIEIRERHRAGNYIRVDDFEYADGILWAKGISVFDHKGNEIYSSPIDAVTNRHDYDETNKYFYNDHNKKLYVFWYGTNGQFSCMMSYNPNHNPYLNEFKQDFRLEDLPGLPDFNWPEMEYYHHAEPVVPADSGFHE